MHAINIYGRKNNRYNENEIENDKLIYKINRKFKNANVYSKCVKWAKRPFTKNTDQIPGFSFA